MSSSINQTNNKYRIKKTSHVMFGFSVVTFLFNQIYAQFSHGVGSQAMSRAFLTVLVFGTLFYAVLAKVKPSLVETRGYRALTNLYNTGLAAVVIGQILQGIVEIAGTGTPFIKYYYGFGYVAMSHAVVLLALIHFTGKK